jgi:SNF2 family DNA or RNA helicase
MNYTLFEHQKASLRFADATPIIFDTSDPGTGKTLVYLNLIDRNNKATQKRALVICPKSLMRSAWGNDIKKFAPWLSTSIASAVNRADAFKFEADVYITNHDAVNWLVKQRPSFFEKFSTLIVDESGAYKHHTSLRSKALNKIASHFQYRYGLNGTPMTNSVTDIWNQVKFLDGGKRLGKSFFAFRDSVCRPKQVGPSPNMVKWEDKVGAEDAVTMLLKDIIIRNKLEECVDLPENIMYTVPYYFSEKQKAAYIQMEMAEIAALEDGSVISAINAASVMTKLLQISSGAVYEMPDVYHVVDEGRYQLIMDLIEARDHSVTFFLWKHQRDLLVETARKRKISFAVIDGSVSEKERAQIVTQYQQGMYQTIFAHPQSTAHGLTLTRGNTTIWASPTYNLEHFQQGNRRIFRIGQKQKTETIVVLADDTCEQRVFDALQNKNVRLTSLLESMRA